jgi:hypothetical protein
VEIITVGPPYKLEAQVYKEESWRKTCIASWNPLQGLGATQFSLGVTLLSSPRASAFCNVIFQVQMYVNLSTYTQTLISSI